MDPKREAKSEPKGVNKDFENVDLLYRMLTF